MTFLFESVRAASRFAASAVQQCYSENVANMGCLVSLVNVFSETRAECVVKAVEAGGFAIDPKYLYGLFASIETVIDSLDEGQDSDSVVNYLNLHTRNSLKAALGKQ